MKRRRRWIVTGAVLAALWGAAYAGYQTGVLHLRPSASRFPVRGIDVSHHQGRIDWPQVARDLPGGFAFIKASEGATFQDPDFRTNWQAAGEAHVARGAYHFFTLCRDGVDQARNFLAQFAGQRGDLPVAIDLEFGGNCGAKPDKAELARELSAFVAAVRKFDDRPPVFYLTPEFHDAYFTAPEQAYPDHRLWIRSVFGAPSQAACTGWTFWQYAANGRVRGIAGPVDLNVFCGTVEAFGAMAGRSG